MIVPGSNLLALALTVIAPQTIVLYRSAGRAKNAVGEWITQYESGLQVEGSWQPIDRAKYEAQGLDLSKKYYTFFASELIESVARNDSPDICERNGRKYSTVGDTPWNDVDGWQKALFVDIGPADL